jgi:hypothetical protein
MAHRGTELRDFVDLCLGELGVPRPYVYGTTGKAHQEVRFLHAGQPLRYCFSASPSNSFRALKQVKTGLRKYLRVAEARRAA